MRIKGDVIYAGTAEGTAVIVDGLSGKLPVVEKGQVAVVRYLPVDASEIIMKASGIVMLGGGLLSHVAILARELRIPAVRVPEDVDIPDGARVLINGAEVVVKRSF